MNPLLKHVRPFKLNVNFPTQGKWYPDGYYSSTIDGTLPVRGLSASDEYSLQSPDSLISGQVLVDIAKSCVPSINGDAADLLMPDLNSILLAVRAASKGEIVMLDMQCEHCNKSSEIPYSIREGLENAEIVEEFVHITKEGCKIHAKPNSFRYGMKQISLGFQQTKLEQLLKEEQYTDDDRIAMVKDFAVKLREVKFEMLSDAILKIVTPDGVVVDDKRFILEYVQQVDSDTAKVLEVEIARMNETGVAKHLITNCPACGHEQQINGVNYNPMLFFSAGS